MDEPPTPHRGTQLAVAIIALVGVYDVATGAYELGTSTPWHAHGPGTVWSSVGPTVAGLQGEAHDAVMAAFRRVGAFSLYAGLVSLFVAVRFRQEPRHVLAFMLLYMVAGLGFAVTDATYFAGTPYHLTKQAIGVLWVVGTFAAWRAVKAED